MERAWIATRHDEVRAALEHPDLHTRPKGQQVPAAMEGTALGDIFARLVRMNEGDRHRELRQRVTGTIEGWHVATIAALAREALAAMSPDEVGTYTIARLIGIAQPAEAMPLIRDFAAAIAGGASDEEIAAGIAATPRLLDLLPPIADPDERANTMGLLFQVHIATTRPVVLTRRWAARDLDLCGTTIATGDEVVVLLTSPAFRFGAGTHACPGERIARAIIEAQ